MPHSHLLRTLCGQRRRLRGSDLRVSAQSALEEELGLFGVYEKAQFVG